MFFFWPDYTWDPYGVLSTVALMQIEVPPADF